MRMIMNIEKLTSLEILKNFNEEKAPYLLLSDAGKQEKYQFIQKILIKFNYITCNKASKGIIISFLMITTQYSRQQLARLIVQYKKTGVIKHKPARHNGFAKKYSKEDIKRLAEVDLAHEKPCGHASKKLCERAYHLFHDERYKNIANLSISHLYNLRATKQYQRHHRHFEKTKPKKANIGERRKPQANGKPGYIRIDTVHQGDLNKQKGIYHINAVDEVTQFEIVLSVQKISEHYLIPIVEEILHCFPFKVIGFHSDNGSEYINYTTLGLLNKLLIEFTKSRSRQSNDNALVESKNASIVRKQFGYSHIQQGWATHLNDFNRNFLYPYINFHRPCLFAEISIDSKGKQVKKYPYKKMMTPYEKLKSLRNSQQYLKSGTSFEILDKQAMKLTDFESAEALLKARQLLFKQIFEQQIRN